MNFESLFLFLKMCEIIKKCNACLEEKCTTDYYYSKQNDRYENKCKKCTRNKIPAQTKPFFSIKGQEKVCKECLLLLPLNKYYFYNNYYLGKCKGCYNKLRDKEYSNQYRLNNKSKINERERKRFRNNTLNRLRKLVKSSINRALLKQKDTKSKHAKEVLGCTFEEFRDYIERQFENWMSWGNHGNVCGTELDYKCSWDLDHIIPISRAKNEEEIYLLNHWSNFQPLCSKVNRDEKKAKVFPVTNLELGITITE